MGLPASEIQPPKPAYEPQLGSIISQLGIISKATRCPQSISGIINVDNFMVGIIWNIQNNTLSLWY